MFGFIINLATNLIKKQHIKSLADYVNIFFTLEYLNTISRVTFLHILNMIF